MKITLRRKLLSSGRETLYLDFYPPIPHPETGKPTRRQFLNLFIYSEIEYEEQTSLDEEGKTQIKVLPILDKKGSPKLVRLDSLQKEHNKNTKYLAENIKAQRQLLIQAENYGFLKKEKGYHSFLAFVRQLADKHKLLKKGDKNNLMSVYKYLAKFSNDKCEVKDITETFCNDFKDYLLQTKCLSTTKDRLKNNSAVLYFNIFKRLVGIAYKKGLIEKNVVGQIPAIKKEETRREYLTLEELQALAKTECDVLYLKQAALFSALTGLRYGDIEKLKWDEIEGDEATGYQIRFTQEKTKGQETLPISNEAHSLLGTKSTGRVFPKLLYSAWQNMKIQEWLYKANVYKKISFHAFRHTFATLQLKHGTDLYTISKMLGHKNITTTQIYAKIIDETKKIAANKIRLTV